MAITICTFNANNLFLRYKFIKTFPGDIAGKSLVKDPKLGYLPLYQKGSFEIFNDVQRKLAATAIMGAKKKLPDILCMQEIESLLALRMFNEAYLGGFYKFACLLDSRDFRQIDVGVLSTLPISRLRTHVDDLDGKPDDPKKPWLFSRDCLEVEFDRGKGGDPPLTLFVNHLKSKFPGIKVSKAQKAAKTIKDNALRNRQAKRVLQIVNERFPGPQFGKANYAVVGDFNDQPGSAPVRPLVHGGGLVDAISLLPPNERWTNWYRSENTVSQLDYFLMSPAIAKAVTAQRVRIERGGISFRTKSGPSKQVRLLQKDQDPSPLLVPFNFQRFPKVNVADYASDHCPVFVTIP